MEHRQYQGSLAAGVAASAAEDPLGRQRTQLNPAHSLAAAETPSMSDPKTAVERCMIMTRYCTDAASSWPFSCDEIHLVCR